MAFRRPPKNVATLTDNAVFGWDVKLPSVSQGAVTGPIAVSRRPYFPYGSYITLPSGSKFRKATSYEHESWTLGSYTPYRLKGTAASGSGWRVDLSGDREVHAFTQTYFNSDARLTAYSSPDVRNESSAKALLKLADEKVNVGENLATLGQSLRLVASTAKPLFELLNEAMQDGRFGRNVRSLLFRSYRQIREDGVDQVIAKRYLEYIYGLKPLVQDVYAAFDLAKGAASHDLLLKAVGTADRSYTRGADKAWKRTGYGWYKVLDATCTQHAKTVLHARLDPEYAGLRLLNQLGLLNPFSLAWELVPWSFVVDWFLPIGSVLSSWSAPVGLKFIDGSVSVRTTQNSTFEYAYGYHYDDPTIKVSEKTRCVVPHTYEGYWRQALSNFPRPLPWVDPDPFRGDRHYKALALSIVALGHRKNQLYSRLG